MAEHGLTKGQELAEEYEATWEQRLKEKFLLKRMDDTQQMANVYAASRKNVQDPLTQLGVDPADRKFYEMARQERSDFTKKVDQAYAQNRGNIPVEFWMDFSASTLSRLIDEDMFNTYGDDMNTAMNLQVAQFHVDERNRKDAEVDERYNAEISRIETGAAMSWASKEYLARYDFEQIREDIHTDVFQLWDLDVGDEIDNFLEQSKIQLKWIRDNKSLAAFNAMGGQDLDNPFTSMDNKQLNKWFDDQAAFLEAVGIEDLTDLTNAKIDELLELQEAGLRERIRAAGGQKLNEILTPGETVGMWGETGQALMWGLDKALNFGGLVMEYTPILSQVLDDTQWIVDTFRGTEEELREEQMEEVAALHGFPRSEIFAREFSPVLEEAWAEIETELPEFHQEYMQMGNGDPIMAMGLFGADLQGQLTPEQQTELIDSKIDQDNIVIEAIRDADYSPGSKIMHILGGLDRLGPSRLNTWMTLLIDDMEYFDKAMEGEWIKQFKRMEANAAAVDYQASRVLGIDGSLAGFILDFGGSIMFDPTTWLFGPTGGAIKGGTSKGILKAVAEDLGRFAADPSKGPKAMYHLLDWTDPITRGTILSKFGFNSKIIPQGKWALNPNKAHIVKRSFLDDLLSPDEYRAVKVVDVDNMRASISERGFDEAIEVSISRGDGTIWISQGKKRVMASDELSHIPVRIRVTDEVAQGGRVVPGYTDDAVKQMDRLAGYTATGKLSATESAETTRAVLKTIEAARDSDLDAVIGQISRNGETFIAKHATNESGSFTYLETLDGTLVGGNYVDDIAFDAAYRGEKYRGMAGELSDLSDKMGDASILNNLMNYADSSLASFSDDGARFLRNEISKRLDDALPTGNSVGRNLDDILEKGESLPQIFKVAGENSDVIARPSSILPERLVMGEFGNTDELVELLVEAEKNGALFHAGQQMAIAQASGETIRKLLNASAPGRWLERFITPTNVMKQRNLTDVHVIDDLMSDLGRMFGADSVSIDEHMATIMTWEMKHAADAQKSLKALQTLQPRQQRLLELLDEIGGLYGGRGKISPELFDTLDSAAKAKYNSLRKLAAQEDKAVKKALLKIDKESGSIGATDELGQIMDDIWDDFNRKHISPQWAKIENAVDDTGLVSWDLLRRGPRQPGSKVVDNASVFSDDMKRVADDLNIKVDDLMDTLSHSQNSLLSKEMPLSPLEMIVASSVSGAKYTRASHVLVVANAKNVVHAVHNLWTIDKVFTVATAATVSFDELLRIWHRFGAKAFYRWTADRGIHMEARIRNVVQRRGLPKKGPGAEFLSKPKQARLQALKNYTTRLKSAERQNYDEIGLGFQDILKGSPEFRDAAGRWTAGMLQDSGFRAFLGGRAEFRKWFLSPDGERLRLSSVMTGKDGKTVSMLADSADDFFDGWSVLFDDVVLKPATKAGKYNEVRAAWIETGEKIAASGGVAHDVPDIVINHLDSVRGVRRELPNQMGTARLTEAFFENLFMNPVNYRRGFLAELVRTQEKSRLYALFNQQGRRIVTDVEVEQILGVQGLAGSQKSNLQGVVHSMALKQGVIPESYIDNLVERAVRAEIENTLYQFDKGSRLGMQSKVVFPFGKPWADMAAFWGREMVRKPVLRGFVNEKNLFYLRSLNSKGMLPFNRTQTMISRLANTDFTIDKGLLGGEGEGFLHEGGLIPGSESTNFSPLFFLPTKGDNPFSYMLPGIGIVPTFAISWLMDSLHDPVDDPVGYQELQDTIGQFVPAAQYMQGGVTARILGGGSTAKIAGMTADIGGMLGHSTLFDATNAMGDISREIARTREISALLAQPEELALLMEAETVQDAEIMLEALAVEADSRASQAHLAKAAVRFMGPIGAEFSASLGEIQDVWLDATSMPELAFLAPTVNVNNMTEESRRQLAADVRTAFFSLEDWQRDMLIVQQPSLAVNLVGSWEWTPEAQNMNVEGSDRTYRSGGTKKDLAKHEALVRQGLIRPVQPIVRARRILGTIDNAKRQTAKKLYQDQVDRVNSGVWLLAQADEQTMAMLGLVLNSDFGRRYGLETTAEVWEHWGRLEEDYELYVAGIVGMDPIKGISTKKEDITEFDRLRRAFNIPKKLKAWNRDWPGLDEGEVSRKFNDFPVLSVSPKSAALAKALELDLEIGMSGEELYEMLQQSVVQRKAPIMDLVRPSYDDYIGDRTTQSTRTMMFEAAQSDRVAPAVQEKIFEFMFKDELLRDRRADDRRNGLSLADQDNMRREFLFIMNGAKNQKTDWEGIWDAQYARVYGPLDWIPPDPKPPVVEGQLQNDVMIPIIEHVVDGDTLFFRMNKNSPILSSVRLLGIRAPEKNQPGALEYEDKLKDALLQAVEDGDSIYLVRDERFGDTDHYGRMLAWLWIGDTPFYNIEDLRPHQDPSGRSEN